MTLLRHCSKLLLLLVFLSHSIISTSSSSSWLVLGGSLQPLRSMVFVSVKLRLLRDDKRKSLEWSFPLFIVDVTSGANLNRRRRCRFFRLSHGFSASSFRNDIDDDEVDEVFELGEAFRIGLQILKESRQPTRRIGDSTRLLALDRKRERG